MNKLKELYSRANQLNDELPGDVVKKMELYADILTLTGKHHAEALKEWKLAEATRKEAYATVIQYTPQVEDGYKMTVAEKEARAEMACSDWRKKEAEGEADTMRWKNAYNSTNEYLQVLKIKYRDLVQLNNGGI